MKKLRLLLTEDCNRNCPGCCNKQWDLATLPLATDFYGYDEILLTGGEPMLYPDLVIDTVAAIRKQSTAAIYLYTAKLDNFDAIQRVLMLVEGITITLHTTHDIIPFVRLANFFYNNFDTYEEDGAYETYTKSLRLNVFKPIVPRELQRYVDGWDVKWGVSWIKPCPLPKDEVFRRLNKSVNSSDIIVGGTNAR